MYNEIKFPGILKNNIANLLLILFISVLSLCISVGCQAQEIRSQHDTSTILSSRIIWLKQFPSLDNKGGDKRTTGKILDFIAGKNKDAKLSKPVSVLAFDTNSFWVLDQGIGNLFKVENELGDIPHIRNHKNKTFNSLVDICSFSNNKFLFTDSFLNKIFIYDPGKRELNVINDLLLLEQPTGIAYSSERKEIWVVETRTHRISILNENGQLIKSIGTRGSAPGEFNYPTSIWIDKSGKVFIVDALNFRIQIFSPEGEFISSFGKQGDATGYFARPKGIASDSSGNIYVVDALFHAVQIFDESGNFLYTFGVQGHEKGNFWMPSGIYIDEHDYIYVADCYNSRIQIFQRINGGTE